LDPQGSAGDSTHTPGHLYQSTQRQTHDGSPSRENVLENLLKVFDFLRKCFEVIYYVIKKVCELKRNLIENDDDDINKTEENEDWMDLDSLFQDNPKVFDENVFQCNVNFTKSFQNSC